MHALFVCFGLIVRRFDGWEELAAELQWRTNFSSCDSLKIPAI